MVETVISIRARATATRPASRAFMTPPGASAIAASFPAASWSAWSSGAAPPWWRRAIRAGTRLLVLDFADTIAGYASYGRNRMPALAYGGEIFELYLAPEYQGVRPGRRMFEAARADLAAHGYPDFRRMGAWRTTNGRWISTIVGVARSCAAREKDLATRRASASLSASS